MACPIGPALWTPVNLTEKYPGYRILDRNAPEYQMEAFMYTCVILLFYTVATGAFMVKFILQAREPWESADSDSPGAAGGLPMVVKLREQERHRKLVERQARRDVKMRMIKQLRQMSLTGLNLERRNSGGSIDTQVTSFSSDPRGPIGSMLSNDHRSRVILLHIILLHCRFQSETTSPLVKIDQQYEIFAALTST